MPLSRLFASIVLTLGVLSGPSSWAAELNVYLKTTPPQESLRPFVDPTSLSVLITGADGKPVSQGTVLIRIDAPPRGNFFSTDYPLVEGTLLSELHLPLVKGKANWKYLFPIRGDYRLAVDASTEDGRRVNRTFNIHVRESGTKWFALSAFSAGLFGLGFFAGRVFTGAAVSVLVVIGPLCAGAGESASVQRQPDARNAALRIGAAAVGAPSELQWSLAGAQSPAGVGALSLTITHLEKQKAVFAVENMPVGDHWSMKFHFPDGGEYRVAAVALLPGKPPVKTEQVVSVEGVEPPSGPMARAVAYFIALIAAGLAAGRWSKRRKLHVSRFAPEK